jgi:hypothetical protein
MPLSMKQRKYRFCIGISVEKKKRFSALWRQCLVGLCV